MAQAPARLSVKLNLNVGSSFDASSCIPVFHQWVGEKSMDELLIDVADYRHVSDGPGILLVGLEGDYGIEEAGGRFGLRYTRKRSIPNSFTDTLLLAYQRAVAACVSLRLDASVAEHFPDTHASVDITVFDRLKYATAASSPPSLIREVALLFASIYGASGAEAEYIGVDERRPLSIRVSGEPPSFDRLKHRLDALTPDRLSAAGHE